MTIRPYLPTDYAALATLYKHSDQFTFDEVTDSESNLNRKISRDSDSILVAEENGLVGSVSIIEDGRIALLFRLVVSPLLPNSEDILVKLVSSAEALLKERGYLEVHTTAPANDLTSLMQRQRFGFVAGEAYTWYWKKLI